MNWIPAIVKPKEGQTIIAYIKCKNDIVTTVRYEKWMDKKGLLSWMPFPKKPEYTHLEVIALSYAMRIARLGGA